MQLRIIETCSKYRFRKLFTSMRFAYQAHMLKSLAEPNAATASDTAAFTGSSCPSANIRSRQSAISSCVNGLRLPCACAHACVRTRERWLGVVHNSRIGVFADAGIRISFGHIWLLFGLFQLACGTRRRQNPGTKKARRFRRA